jgi:hypothetical protein
MTRKEIAACVAAIAAENAARAAKVAAHEEASK